MGFFNDLLGLGNQIGGEPHSILSWLGQNQAIGPLLLGGTGLIQGLIQPKPSKQEQANIQYLQDKLAAETALSREEMANRLAIAQIQAAAAGAGSGVAAQVERMRDARERQLALLQAQLESAKANDPSVMNLAGVERARAAQATGQLGQEGFMALAQLLQKPLLRG